MDVNGCEWAKHTSWVRIGGGRVAVRSQAGMNKCEWAVAHVLGSVVGERRLGAEQTRMLNICGWVSMGRQVERGEIALDGAGRLSGEARGEAKWSVGNRLRIPLLRAGCLPRRPPPPHSPPPTQRLPSRLYTPLP